MSESRKHKSKRKRGQTLATLSGYTPYSVEECVARIKAGHSPFRSFDVNADLVDDTLMVELARAGGMWPEPVWFEAILIAGDRLTEVQGRIKYDISIWDMLLVLNIPLALVMFVAAFSQNTQLFLIVGMILGVLVLFTGASIQYRRKLARILREWLTDRLDI